MHPEDDRFVPPQLLQRLAGHKRIKTTMRYILMSAAGIESMISA